jgi:hypothetical protein
MADLTYMSIAATLAALEAQGKVMRYVPSSRRRPARRLYLTEEAQRDRTDPNCAVNLLTGSTGRSFIEAALTRWTLGEKVYSDERGRCRFLCRLEPPPEEIWDIRVTEPRPQARLFGRFAEPDTLVVTKFHTRSYLGDKGSANWQQAMVACETKWRSLFGDILFVGTNIHEYVTGNCDDFPI